MGKKVNEILKTPTNHNVWSFFESWSKQIIKKKKYGISETIGNFNTAWIFGGIKEVLFIFMCMW